PELLAASIAPLPRPDVVAAAVPGASKFGALQRPELKRQRRIAASIRHRMKLAVHVRDEYRLTFDIDRLDLAGRDVGGAADAPVHRPLGPPQSHLQQRLPCDGAGSDHELLEAYQARPARPPEIVA